MGTIPRTLVEGVVVGATRLGVALPLTAAPGVLLLPSAGVTLAGIGSLGGGGGTYGYNAGGAAVFGAGTVGFRAGITWHRLASSPSSAWLLEIGFLRLPAPANAQSTSGTARHHDPQRFEAVAWTLHS